MIDVEKGWELNQILALTVLYFLRDPEGAAVGGEYQVPAAAATGAGLHHLRLPWFPCGPAAALHARESGVSADHDLP